MAEEKTFFQHDDVSVTNARFVVGAETFAMSNITSVKASEKIPSRTWPSILIFVGVVFLFNSMIAPALFFGGCGVGWWLLEKPMYHVLLTTAGGETSALRSKQSEYIATVVKALNDAIVHRG